MSIFFYMPAICARMKVTDAMSQLPVIFLPCVSLSDYQPQVDCMLLWQKTTTLVEKESISPAAL